MSKWTECFTVFAAALTLGMAGCGKAPAERQASKDADKTATANAQGELESAHPQAGGKKVIKDGSVTAASYAAAAIDPAQIAFAKLQPLQVLVGTWRGVTARSIGGARALEDPVWNWDFLSDSLCPALVLKSPTSPYLRKARLTYVVDRKMYHLAVADSNDGDRIYEGNFTQAPQDTLGANGDMQRTFKLHLTQATTAPERDELTISQENNDSYLLEVHRTSENGELQHYDTVKTVREGEPIAIEPEKFGKHRCLVSGGLGAIPATHAGKTYYVCCEGCKAAFDANPMRWIAAASQSADRP